MRAAEKILPQFSFGIEVKKDMAQIIDAESL